MNSRLGFVSATGIVAAAALMLGLLGWTLISGPVLFSPGPLNAQPKALGALGGVSTHAQLAGDCGACHAAPWSSKTMADQCLRCHTQIGDQIRNRAALHGALLGKLSGPSTCRGCHTEHLGPAGALTVKNATGFPHELTGYSLRGHQRTSRGVAFTCTDCHLADLAHFNQATCADCHAAMDRAFMTKHEASFGSSCLVCHNGNGRNDFDHNKLAFPLTGKHAGLDCARCHTDSATIQALRQTPQECGACHAKDDKHTGSFGQLCGQCHNTNAWTGAQFSHTAFPLDHGRREQAATCQLCHPLNTSTYTCFGCHAHTTGNIVGRHEGRSLAELADCIRCHAGGRRGDN